MPPDEGGGKGLKGEAAARTRALLRKRSAELVDQPHSGAGDG